MEDDILSHAVSMAWAAGALPPDRRFFAAGLAAAAFTAGFLAAPLPGPRPLPPLPLAPPPPAFLPPVAMV